jgi:hypothetical protein
LHLRFRTGQRSGSVQAGESTADRSGTKLKLRRATVLKFFCPACPAKPGQPCVIEGTGEVRDKLHRDRVEKAERLISAVLRQHGKLPA